MKVVVRSGKYHGKRHASIAFGGYPQITPIKKSATKRHKRGSNKNEPQMDADKHG
jgi:hypothetical protein